MRVRKYGRTAMTHGVLAAILAVVPAGVAPLMPHGAGSLRSGAAAAEEAGDTAGEGATTGSTAAGQQGDVDGSRGSGGVSSEQSSSGSATGGAAGGSGGSETDAAGSAGGSDGDGGGRGGASTAGASSADPGSADSTAGGVEADASGRTSSVNAAPLGGARSGPAYGGAPAAEDAGGGTITSPAPTVPAGRSGKVSTGRRDAGDGGPGGSSVTRGRAAAEVPVAPATLPARLTATRVERDGDGIALVYSSGIRERLAAGRYEMQDASGKVVNERPAMPRDAERMRENARLSGLVVVSEAALPPGSDVESIAVTPEGMAIRYREGWTEDLIGLRYRFADPDGNTVVDRPATAEDRNRLLAIATGG